MFAHSKLKKKEAFIFPEAIVFVSGFGNSVKMVSASGKTRLVDGTLTNTLAWLLNKGQNVFQCHKSHLVNMDYVMEFEDGKIIFWH